MKYPLRYALSQQEESSHVRNKSACSFSSGPCGSEQYVNSNVFFVQNASRSVRRHSLPRGPRTCVSLAETSSGNKEECRGTARMSGGAHVSSTHASFAGPCSGKSAGTRETPYTGISFAVWPDPLHAPKSDALSGAPSACSPVRTPHSGTAAKKI